MDLKSQNLTNEITCIRNYDLKKCTDLVKSAPQVFGTVGKLFFCRFFEKCLLRTLWERVTIIRRCSHGVVMIFCVWKTVVAEAIWDWVFCCPGGTYMYIAHFLNFTPWHLKNIIWNHRPEHHIDCQESMMWSAKWVATYRNQSTDWLTS